MGFIIHVVPKTWTIKSEVILLHMRVNIEAERGRLQMSKGDMCKALGVTLKIYNAYIRGAAIPSTALEKLKGMTGCSVDHLLGLDSEYTGT